MKDTEGLGKQKLLLMQKVWNFLKERVDIAFGDLSTGDSGEKMQEIKK